MYHNQEWLQEKYWDEELSLREMARLAGCCGRTIVNWMERHGIARRVTGRNTPRTQEELFWSRIGKAGKDECWEWTARRNGDGYGTIWFDGRDQGAHRIMWQLTYGEVPEGKYICHHCDNPPCVNPGHLYIGNAQTNADDRESRSRSGKHKRCGENNANSKLTWAQVREIRALYATGEWTQTKLAERFDALQVNISRVVNHKSWKE